MAKWGLKCLLPIYLYSAWLDHWRQWRICYNFPQVNTHDLSGLIMIRAPQEHKEQPEVPIKFQPWVLPAGLDSDPQVEGSGHVQAAGDVRKANPLLETRNTRWPPGLEEKSGFDAFICYSAICLFIFSSARHYCAGVCTFRGGRERRRRRHLPWWRWQSRGPLCASVTHLSDRITVLAPLRIDTKTRWDHIWGGSLWILKSRHM